MRGRKEGRGAVELRLIEKSRPIERAQLWLKRTASLLAVMAALWTIFMLRQMRTLEANEFGDAMNPGVTLFSIAAAVFSLVYILEQLRENRAAHRTELAPIVYLAPALEIEDIFWDSSRRRFAGEVAVKVKAENAGAEGRSLAGELKLYLKGEGRAVFKEVVSRGVEVRRLGLEEESEIFSWQLEKREAQRFLAGVFFPNREGVLEIKLDFDMKIEAQDDSVYGRSGAWGWWPQVVRKDLESRMPREFANILALERAELPPRGVISEDTRIALERVRRERFAPAREVES